MTQFEHDYHKALSIIIWLSKQNAEYKEYCEKKGGMTNWQKSRYNNNEEAINHLESSLDGMAANSIYVETTQELQGLSKLKSRINELETQLDNLRTATGWNKLVEAKVISLLGTEDEQKKKKRAVSIFEAKQKYNF